MDAVWQHGPACAVDHAVQALNRAARTLLACFGGSLALALVAAVVALFCLQTVALTWLQAVPAPLTLPILGSVGVALDPFQLHKFVHRCHRRLGHILRLSLGMSHYVWVSHPDAVGQVLTDLDAFDRDPLEEVVLERFLAGGLIIERNGETWARARALLAPAFQHERTAEYMVFVHIKAQQLVSGLAASCRRAASGVVVEDMERLFLSLTFDVIARISLGIDLDCVGTALAGSKAPQLAAFEQVLRAMHVRFMTPVRYWRWFYLPHDRRMLRSLGVLDDLIRDRMQEAEAGLRRGGVGTADALRSSMLYHMMRQRHERPEVRAWLSDELLRAHLLTLLFAGHDTTANMLTWAAHYMGLHPDIQASVAAEAEAGLPHDAPPSLEQIKGLQLSLQVLKEALRLHPSAPVRPRMLVRDATVLGHRLRRGTLMAWSAYAVHHDPDVWPDAERFDPSRFAPGAPKRHVFAWVPFGAGRRRCGLACACCTLLARILFFHVHRRRVAQVHRGKPGAARGPRRACRAAAGVSSHDAGLPASGGPRDVDHVLPARRVAAPAPPRSIDRHARFRGACWPPGTGLAQHSCVC